MQSKESTDCRLCQAKKKTWNGSKLVCSFSAEDFRDNWNCATLNAIRDIVYEGHRFEVPGVDYRYCDDQKYATICVDHLELGEAITAMWVTWYKSRGRTEAIWMLSDCETPRRPTESECLAVIRHYKATCPKIKFDSEIIEHV